MCRIGQTVCPTACQGMGAAHEEGWSAEQETHSGVVAASALKQVETESQAWWVWLGEECDLRLCS